MSKIEVFADTKEMSVEEWRALRTKGIGGSDAGTILGVNKWKSPFELWLEKTGQSTVNVNNEAIYWGNVLEDIVAQEFTNRTGKKVRRKNQMLQHPEHSFMLANLDRVVVGEKSILEVKTANQFLSKEWEGEEIPPSYLIQLQHYLAVTGYEKGYFAVLIGGQRFEWKEVERDEELIQMMIEAETHFWNYHVLQNIPPAIDGSSSAEQYLKERYAKAEKGMIIDLKFENKEKIERYKELDKLIKDLQFEQKAIKNQLTEELKEAEAGLIQEYQVNWKEVKSNRIDSKLLKEKYPEVAKEVTKESSSRRFEIKEVK